MIEVEKLFELVALQKLQCEKEICDWQDGWKLVCFDIGVCPFNIELCGAEGKTLEEKAYNIKLFLLPGSQCIKGASEIFHDEEEFYRERTMKTMAAESIIPSGTFSPTNDPNYRENSSVILQAKIKRVRYSERHKCKKQKFQQTASPMKRSIISNWPLVISKIVQIYSLKDRIFYYFILK